MNKIILAAAAMLALTACHVPAERAREINATEETAETNTAPIVSTVETQTEVEGFPLVKKVVEVDGCSVYEIFVRPHEKPVYVTRTQGGSPAACTVTR